MKIHGLLHKFSAQMPIFGQICSNIAHLAPDLGTMHRVDAGRPEAECPWRKSMPSPGGWFMCDVIRAGPDYNGHVNIMLTDKAAPPVFAVTWFQALDAVKEEMLAVALCAMSTGIQVNTNLVSVDQGSQILNFYISKT